MADRYFFMMSRIQNRIMAHFKKELKEAGLSFSPGQMGILLALENLDRPEQGITMGELSQILDMDNAALTRLVDSLEKKGLALREINPHNRRQVRAGLTPEGLDQACQVKAIAAKSNQLIREGFTPEEMDVYMRVNQAILDKFES